MKNISKVILVVMVVLSLMRLDYTNLGDWELNKRGYIGLIVSALFGLSLYLRTRKGV